MESKGYEVKLFGSTCPKGKRGKFKKLFGIGIASANFWEAVRLHSFIKKEKPDLIWNHSMLRRMGRLPLRMTRKNKARKWMMYHDFGYFTPYPHLLSDVKDIQTPLSLKNYLAMSKTNNPLKKLFIAGKYLTLNLLKNQLKKQSDLHLVPSEFMVPIVEKSFGLKKGKVQAFNHFYQG